MSLLHLYLLIYGIAGYRQGKSETIRNFVDFAEVAGAACDPRRGVCNSVWEPVHTNIFASAAHEITYRE